MHIGEKIRLVRAIKGIKQTTIARALNITQQSWAERESAGKISLKDWEKIEQVLGMDRLQIERISTDLLERALSRLDENQSGDNS